MGLINFVKIIKINGLKQGIVVVMQRKEISITSKKKLQKLLTLTGVKEQQLEFSRQNLCKIESFEPYASF
jgi:hypothetical protein